jgi:hypothetical protein
MAKISNVFGTTFSGRIGKKMIASSWKGHEYIKTYVKPHNPNTRNQQRARGRFAAAVEAWQGFSGMQQEFYDRIAERMSGFNLFISRYVKAVRAGEEPETPVEMRWKTAGGKLFEDGDLIVLAGKREVFRVGLGEGRAEVALTQSDSPYFFVLKNGVAREEVLEIRDLAKAGVPRVLESKKLGVRLVAY